jgi:hypothetical protein
MRAILVLLLVLLGSAGPVEAAGSKIKKVLIHFIDREGRHTDAPSLYERDAYQAYLRSHKDHRSGLQAAINWRGLLKHSLTLRIQMRGMKDDKETKAEVSQTIIPHSGWARWDKLTLRGEEYEKFGELIAWRVTVWDGEQLLAEQNSYLW